MEGGKRDGQETFYGNAQGTVGRRQIRVRRFGYRLRETANVGAGDHELQYQDRRSDR